MSELSSHLRDHNYWRSEPSSSQSSSTRQGFRKRKRQREPSRVPEEPPQKQLCEGSPSPQPSTSTSIPPQAMLETVQLSVQPGPIQEPVEGPQPDGATALPLLSEPPGLSPAAFDAVSERIMAWMSHTPYSREM